MNEYYKMGEGDEYVEVCLDWERISKEKYTKVLWWLQQTIAGDPYSNKNLKEALLEVANSIQVKDE